MSRPDPTGESLESILASIRKSLSEQSTGVLADEPAAPSDAQKGILSGLARRLSGSADDLAPLVEDAPLPPVEGEPPLVEDAAPVVEEEVPLVAEPEDDAPPLLVREPLPSAAPPAPAVPAPSAAQAQKDALWFLGGRGRSDAPQNGPAATPETQRPAPLPAAEPAPKPAPSRSPRGGVVRGPLPPFFGSSAEAQKAEVVLAQPSAQGAGMMLPPAEQPARVANGQAAASPVEARAADGPRNGAASSLFGHIASADAKAGPEAATPHLQALEAMVAELLRPMLKRWLDENMPRLVANALEDEAVRMAARDPRKR
jgi:cell pole-organizing protein PopZ